MDNQQELRRQYEENEFSDLVAELIYRMNINALPNLSKVYWDIYDHNGKVTGNDIYHFLENLQSNHETEQLFRAQIASFYSGINMLVQKGIKTISRVQYFQIFPSEGLIGEKIAKRVAQFKHVSIMKLKNLIAEIEDSDREDTSKKVVSTYVLEKSDILGSYEEAIQDLSIESIIEYTNENISDYGVRMNIEVLLRRFKRKLYQNENRNSQLEQVIKKKQAKIIETENQLASVGRELENTSEFCHNLKSRLQQKQQELILAGNKLQIQQEQFFHKIRDIQESNNQLLQETRALLFKNKQLEEKLQWFKINYDGLIKEYEVYSRQREEKQQKQKKEKEQRIFQQRSIKEQLEDAHILIKNLRTQNSSLRNKTSQAAQIYEHKITELQERIKEMENSYLNFGKSHLPNFNFEVRNSTLSISESVCRQSKFKSAYGSKLRSIKQLESSISVYSKLVEESKIKKEESKLWKKKKEFFESKVTSILTKNEDDLFEQTDNLLEEIQKNKQGESGVMVKQVDKKRYLTLVGYIINYQGNKFPFSFVFTPSKVSFYDSKSRFQYSINFSQVRKIIFCYTNTSWLVFQVRQDTFNQKKQKLYDMVFDVLKRNELLTFFRNHCATQLLQSKVKIVFDKEENVWIKGPQRELLLSNYENCYNIHKIGLLNGGNIFIGTIKQDGFLPTLKKVIFIVSNIGIIVFQSENDNILDKNQKVMMILPIVDEMKMQIPGSKKLKIQYQKKKKLEYNIALDRSQQIMEMKKMIENEKQTSILRRQQLCQQFQFLASGLNRSIDSQ